MEFESRRKRFKLTHYQIFKTKNVITELQNVTRTTCTSATRSTMTTHDRTCENGTGRSKQNAPDFVYGYRNAQKSNDVAESTKMTIMISVMLFVQQKFSKFKIENNKSNVIDEKFYFQVSSQKLQFIVDVQVCNLKLTVYPSMPPRILIQDHFKILLNVLRDIMIILI